MSVTELAPADVWRNRIYSGGWKTGGAGTIAVTEKATGIEIGSVGAASAADVSAAAAIATQAQRAWAATPGPQRGDVLREVARLLQEHREEIARQIVRETGSIRPKGYLEVKLAIREILEGAALASQSTGVITTSDVRERHSVARRVPMGVVGVITPWNSPLILAARAIAPALATGNAVLLKPDPQTPVSGGILYACLLEIAGLPEGLFHVLPGGAETGDALVRDPQVNMISFTGSTRVGQAIGAVAGGLLKRANLELGGKNPYIVLDDVDVEAAASAGAWGSFLHQGQVCMAAGRHLVQESIADAYIESLVRRTSALTVGDPFKGDFHLGPIINERQAENVDRIVADSVSKGAKILAGGSRDGLFFKPTVMVDVAPGMPVFDEEIFGPVAAVTVFKDDDEAVSLANQNRYGLVAAVASSNLRRAQRIADRLHAGIVHINDQTILHEVFGPMGGVGLSGNGHNYSTLTNADQFTEWQWVTTRDDLPAYPF
ncbi:MULTISPECIES: aldehyde dehydrogenase family protein [Paraburkholderia]|uniref:aldehyde dehydrogenase family protein n=1 Tax=Paraburkholderia TaxID=1822464 RepID=UPI00225969F3|nr:MULTISPECIES: aldehyde dehydrogenase family protein [Paraburkholderia]MCX4163155.1 aldehyde dehydrogenase family protein [Paraburkholderia megapolitana]MDN7158651.1 aldehyde dehydrogenase family protein [Paraburkholderia sp. CHISQ3]MDQ6495698.1 aldehyde dehydrogenase family protein [Paraburkholderia megapolitana]